MCPGVCSRLDRAGRRPRTVSPGSIVRSTSSSRAASSGWASDLDPVALLPDVVLGHVIDVVVGEQELRDVEPVPLLGLEQRPRWPAGVDHDAVPPSLVPHEVGVREPVRLHGAFDDHR